MPIAYEGGKVGKGVWRVILVCTNIYKELVESTTIAQSFFNTIINVHTNTLEYKQKLIYTSLVEYLLGDLLSFNHLVNPRFSEANAIIWRVEECIAFNCVCHFIGGVVVIVDVHSEVDVGCEFGYWMNGGWLTPYGGVYDLLSINKERRDDK